ncbi:MAG TPA: acyltransferase [Galbitalea sp.]|jgi:peptidoglycan/LPS O-acetylase OafA/YrhL|nr:acyltransferase [Galbitalea sp.]
MVSLTGHQGQPVQSVRTGGRLIALDGLRGIAAFVVVLHHVYQVARPFLEPKVNAWAPGSPWWFISSTPIKLLSAGSESVLIFFVLSGLVVPLPLLAKGMRGWAGFFASRLIRLYIPVWASLVLAMVITDLLPHPATAVTAGSWTQRSNTVWAPFSLAFSEAGLTRASFPLNSVLWSLQWEVVFSITLPLFLLAAMALRRFWIPAVVSCFGLSVVGKVFDINALIYLPVFFLGTLLAVNLAAFRAWAQRARIRKHARLAGWLVLSGSLLAIVASWMLRPILHAGTPLSDAVGSLTDVGALGLVACAVGFGPVVSGLSTRVPQWLGKVSFSLYLTQLPILIALVYLLGDNNWALVGVIGIPVDLGVAYLFFRFVEAPSHRLAQQVGRLATRGSERVYVRLRARRVARMAASGREPAYR